MIVGIGTDLVYKPRIQLLWQRFPQRWPEKILSDVEYADWQADPDPAGRLARQFAAKEAILKALGTGMREGLAWHDMVVLRNELGRPTIALQGGVDALVRQRLPQGKSTYDCHLSISDDGDYALAFAVISC